MFTEKLVLRLLIYALLVTAFALGLPVFHYTVALMIALIIRYKDAPGGLFAPIASPEPKAPQGS